MNFTRPINEELTRLHQPVVVEDADVSSRLTVHHRSVNTCAKYTNEFIPFDSRLPWMASP
jgi:hypothetical protein